MIPTNGRPMADAPKNGEIILAVSREWNNPNAPLQVQAAQWLCDRKGDNWAWREPGRMGTTVHATCWFTFAEFQKAQATMEPAKTPNYCPKPAEPEEYDL